MITNWITMVKPSLPSPLLTSAQILESTSNYPMKNTSEMVFYVSILLMICGISFLVIAEKFKQNYYPIRSSVISSLCDIWEEVFQNHHRCCYPVSLRQNLYHNRPYIYLIGSLKLPSNLHPHSTSNVVTLQQMQTTPFPSMRESTNLMLRPYFQHLDLNSTIFNRLNKS